MKPGSNGVTLAAPRVRSAIGLLLMQVRARPWPRRADRLITAAKWATGDAGGHSGQ
jgi:hypothetical protein